MTAGDVTEDRPRYVWAMGLSNAAYGYAFAGVLVTMPQVMAAHGVGEPAIAALTALASFASLATFVIAPVLDTLFARQTWAVGLALLAAVLTMVMLSVSPTGALVAPLMMADALTLVMLTTALGDGWARLCPRIWTTRSARGSRSEMRSGSASARWASIG